MKEALGFIIMIAIIIAIACVGISVIDDREGCISIAGHHKCPAPTDWNGMVVNRRIGE